MFPVTAALTALTLMAAVPAAPTEPAPTDPARAAVVAKGKRLNRISLGMTFTGLGLTLVSILPARNKNYDATIGLASGGLVLAGVGLGFAIAGTRRVLHPERFLAQHAVALAPVVSPRLAGAAVSFRF